MIIIEPSAQIIVFNGITGIDICKHIEKCGRVCYKSEEKITDESYIPFINRALLRNNQIYL